MTATDHTAKQNLDAALEPLIVPAGQHPILNSQIDSDALNVLRKLEKAGFSCYLVGGGVRDLYLQKQPKDFDIGTSARPSQIRKIFPNSNIIGRRFRLVQIFFRNNKIVEVATLRSLSEHDMDGPEAVLAPNNTFGTLDQDAQRRDLTINSLFYEIKNNTIIDYIGGVKDLDDAVIRIVGEPTKRINRDPVRMLRAIRHASRINFKIEKESWKAICINHHKLTLCPPSRLRDELYKDLYSGLSADWFNLAKRSGLFTQLLPVYNSLLPKKVYENVTCEEQLEIIHQVIDRTNNYLVANTLSRPKDFFILALLLLPWAELSFGLSDVPVKGRERFFLSKAIRNELDLQLGKQLNLRKSTRQEIVTLLINIGVFKHHFNHRGWPKWLKKKSYFSKCSLFFSFYREITEGAIIPDNALDQNPRKKEEKPRSNKIHRGRNERPAFSKKKKGGIFGFKK